MKKNWILCFLGLCLIANGLFGQNYFPASNILRRYQPDSILEFSPGTFLNPWKDGGYFAYTYHSSGNFATSNAASVLDDTLRPTERETRQFNTNARLIESITERYVNFQWQPEARFIYDYDAQSSETVKFELSWDGTQWDTTRGTLTSWVYDGANRPSQALFQRWEGPETSLKRYYYGVSGQLDSLRFFAISGVDTVLNEVVKYHSWYNYAAEQANSLTRLGISTLGDTTGEYYEYGYQGTNIAWAKVRYYSDTTFDNGDQLTYDQYGNLTQYYSMINNQPSTLDSYTIQNNYDSQNRIAERIFSMVPPDPWFRQVFVYASSTSADEFTELESHIWPNPSTGTVHIALAANQRMQISIYDLLGRLRLTQDSPMGTTELNLAPERFAPGEYIVEIRTAKAKTTRKIILEH